MKHVMAVYDVDPLYAARFAEVVNQKEKIPFEVIAFSTMERLKQFAKEQPLEILLISGEIDRKEAESVGAGKIITLSGGEGEPQAQSGFDVYKYQSSDNIIREVMACYGEQAETAPAGSSRRRAQILGVYSPVSRCLKTSFAITVGKLLSQDSRTLYVNLEEFSGLSDLTHTEYRKCLSDLLYFYCGGSFHPLRLSSAVYAMEGLDYIPPVRYPEDLEQAGPEQIGGLLKAIAAESAYETLVVDVGSCKRTAVEVLKLSSLVYMPVKEDSVSRAKLEEFDRYLERSGNGFLQEKIRRLKLPYHSCFGRQENYLDQLLWGELGDYTRQLLRCGVRR